MTQLGTMPQLYRQPRGRNDSMYGNRPPTLAEAPSSDGDHGDSNMWSGQDSERSYSSDPSQFSYDEHKGFQMPDQQHLQQELNNLRDDDKSQIAWNSLIKHNKSNKNASYQHYPFVNTACSLLFFGRFNPTLGITRNITQWVLTLLRTLQVEGHLDSEYFIPKDASTIEKWWKYIPQPPLSMFN